MDWAGFLTSMHWGIYLLIFLAPFVQEDAAVVGAASASLSGADPVAAFVVLVLGLSCSDLWKYWAGRAAHAFAWTRRAAERPDVASLREKVVRRLGMTLLIARFVPGTRIPLYLACGVFRAPFPRFALFVVASGILYAGLMFGLFHAAGAAMGERAREILPLAALGMVALVLAIQLVRSLLARRAAAAAAPRVSA
jgi:membrane protein DedA with SNARE-associated domain